LGLSVGIGVLAAARAPGGRPLVVYNASASAPIGDYWVGPPRPLRRGDLVLARTPASVRALAAARGYLPASVFLVKRIAALGGDRVCGDGSVLRIDGRVAARPLRTDRMGRPLVAWRGCRRLRADEVLLLMQGVPASFDGRYFGPTPAGEVVGRLRRAGRP
jgi:conjugative transfer signal peptidase TraF